jgi:hypothetical protein
MFERFAVGQFAQNTVNDALIVLDPIRFLLAPKIQVKLHSGGAKHPRGTGALRRVEAHGEDMAQDLLNLQITEQAQIACDTLGPEERRLVSSWFDHLRNWRNDNFIRSKSRRLETDEEVYVFQTSSDLVIAFRIDGDQVTVLSVFRGDALRAFSSALQRTAS